MSHTFDSAASAWVPVRSIDRVTLTDARLQLHHAAQVANAPAISYLVAAPDDSHTNFGWSADLRAHISQRVTLPRPLRFGLRPADLTLFTLDDANAVGSPFALGGHTVADAHAWAKARCEAAGGEGGRYTSRKHYEIPAHAVDSGAKFGADGAATQMFAQLWDNAARFLDAVAASNSGVSEIRLWPHHFDVGFILTIDAKRSIGGGFSPGDGYYNEPYWYVSPYPKPEGPARPALGGGAHWHEKEFFSAVLPLSAYADSASQGAAVSAYLRSALAGARSLLGA